MNGPLLNQPMIKTLCTIALIGLYSSNVLGQNIIGVIDYVKVDDVDEYLEVEKAWKKIHEERLKEGMIISWSLYQVMYKTVDDPYNFISISMYDSFSKLDKGVPENILNAAYPEKNEDDWESFDIRTYRSRKVITSSIFHQQLSCSKGLDRLGKYYVINEINVKQGASKEYIRINEEIYKPLFEEDIKNNNRTNWSLWAKWPGDTKDFHYLSADGYADLDQMEPSNYIEYFNKIHPHKNFDKISARVEELRTLENSEMWKVIHRIF